MKFQICTCGKLPFVHGNFFDENGPHFRGEGLEHLSKDIFSKSEALIFIQESEISGEITKEEASVLKYDKVMESLPEERPSNVDLCLKNEINRVKNMVTREGKRQLSMLAGPQFSFEKIKNWFLRHW